MVEIGAPSFVMYGAESLGLRAIPTDIKQLPDGRLVIAAQNELVIGDGVRWELVRRTEDSSKLIYSERDLISRSIAVDDQGRLFAGLRDGFARIEFGTDGHWRFVMEAVLNTEADRRWPEFQRVEQVDGHWYWHSASGIVLKWDLKGAPEPAGGFDSIDRIFSLGDQVFVSDYASGAVHRMSKGAAVPCIKREDTNPSLALSCAAPYSKDQVLVGTNAAGLFLFDGTSLKPFGAKGVLGGQHRINDLCLTAGRYYAAAVDTYGIVFFDRNGRVIQTLDKTLDPRLARVQRLFITREGVLWALYNDGVARIEFPSRISHMEPLLGAGLSYVEPMRHEGELWLHAAGRVLKGLYNEERRLVGFEDRTPPSAPVFTLHTPSGRLVATSEEGINIGGKEGWERRIAGPVNARIVARSSRPDWWVYIARREIGLIKLTGDNAGDLERFPDIRLDECYGSVQDTRGVVWLEFGYGRVGRLDPNAFAMKVEMMDVKNGIPESWASLFMLDGEVRLNASNNTLRYDEARRLWMKDDALLVQYPMLATAVGRPFRDVSGRLWVYSSDEVRILETGGVKGAMKVVEALPAGFSPDNFFDDDSGVVWMFDKRHFLRYDPTLPQMESPLPRAVITRLDLAGSARTLFSPPSKLGTLQYEDNSLAVHFMAPGNPFGNRSTFEFMLEGNQDRWVSTGIVGSAVFNQLKEGSYVLRVRPRLGERTGGEARLEFVILPPWYRSITAYAAYAFSGMLALAGSIFLPLYWQRLQKERLERLVTTRTRELNEANEQLAAHVKEAMDKATALQVSEDKHRRLSSELEHRVEERTAELKLRIREAEELNRELQISQKAADAAAARFQEANANLLVANQELESFSYSVSHDLRAPLRNISGFIELMRRRLKPKEDPEIDRFVEIISSEAQRMGALIDDLLTFSRIGRSEMRLEMVHLEKIIDQVRQELAHDLNGRNVEWRVGHLAPVRGDQVLLRQVVANLLGNAVKFTRKRELAIIEIGMESAGQGAEPATFFVRDNGVGFNAQYVEKLFNVFQRLHNNRDYEGTGIGLANVKRIITRHGGRVWATGRVDGGATFYFTLKRATEDAGQKPVA